MLPFNYKIVFMKTLLFVFILLVQCGFLNAQTDISGAKSYALFGLPASQSAVLSEMEPILKAESSFEMVRVDYSRNSVFIVSRAGKVVNAQFIEELLKEKSGFIVCSQYGIYGYDEANFNAFYNCLAQ